MGFLGWRPLSFGESFRLWRFGHLGWERVQGRIYEGQEERKEEAMSNRKVERGLPALLPIMGNMLLSAIDLDKEQITLFIVRRTRLSCRNQP